MKEIPLKYIMELKLADKLAIIISSVALLISFVSTYETHFRNEKELLVRFTDFEITNGPKKQQVTFRYDTFIINNGTDYQALSAIDGLYWDTPTKNKWAVDNINSSMVIAPGEIKFIQIKHIFDSNNYSDFDKLNENLTVYLPKDTRAIGLGFGVVGANGVYNYRKYVILGISPLTKKKGYNVEFYGQQRNLIATKGIALERKKVIIQKRQYKIREYTDNQITWENDEEYF